MRAALWRLPLSALLAQSVLQLLCTLLLMSTLFTALEHVVGGVKLLLIAPAAHVLPTIAVDLFAMWQRWPRVP
jgi:membrane associated rhomboid family serine protease